MAESTATNATPSTPAELKASRKAEEKRQAQAKADQERRQKLEKEAIAQEQAAIKKAAEAEAKAVKEHEKAQAKAVKEHEKAEAKAKKEHEKAEAEALAEARKEEQKRLKAGAPKITAPQPAQPTTAATTPEPKPAIEPAPKPSLPAVAAPPPVGEKSAPSTAPGSLTKAQRLDRLKDDYVNNRISALEYHRQRSKILAEP